MLFPVNEGLAFELKYLRDLRQDADEDFYEEYRQESEHRIEEEIVSYARFLLPIDVWEDDLVTRTGGGQAIRDGAAYEPCLVRGPSGTGGKGTYLPLFTEWGDLYEGPYPGHVHVMVVTFKDCLRLIEESGDERGLSINIDGQRQLLYDASDLVRLAALRESLIKARRLDEQWGFGAYRPQSPNMVLRGQQDRVRMYLPGDLVAGGHCTDGSLGTSPDAAYGVCGCTVPLAPGAATGDLLREVLRALNRVRPDLVRTDDVWEVYAQHGSETELMIGRVSWVATDGGRFRLEQMVERCPDVSFLYCAHLSRSLLDDMDADSYARARSAFTLRLREAMRYCALDNTYLRGCAYTYSGDEAMREYTRALVEREKPEAGITVLVSLLMLALGALLTYVTRAALWPGALAVIGCLLFLLVLPVVAGERVAHLIHGSRAIRRARQQMADVELPSAGQHHARFSMRRGRVWYRDEARELTWDGCLDGRAILESEHYLFCPRKHGAVVPVPKSAL